MKRGKEERVSLNGPAGGLEVVINFPVSAADGCAIIAHPHPLYGGSLDNKVVQTLSKAFSALGLISVRFNFRGVGQSDGVYDEGNGELEDFRATLHYSRERFELSKTIFAGFSFGTYIVSDIAREVQPDGLVLVAPAVGKFDVGVVSKDALVIHGELDDVVPMKEVMDWARPQRIPVVTFPGAGHFFHGDLIRLQNTVTRYCSTVIDL